MPAVTGAWVSIKQSPNNPGGVSQIDKKAQVPTLHPSEKKLLGELWTDREFLESFEKDKGSFISIFNL